MGTSSTTVGEVGIAAISCASYPGALSGWADLHGVDVTERSSPSPLGASQYLRLNLPWGKVETLTTPFSISQLSRRSRKYLTWLFDEALTEPFEGRQFDRNFRLTGGRSMKVSETLTRRSLETHLYNLLADPSSSRTRLSRRHYHNQNHRSQKWHKTGATSPRAPYRASSAA